MGYIFVARIPLSQREVRKLRKSSRKIIEGRENTKGNCIYGKFNIIAIVTGKHASDKRYR